ncbi:MAG: ABC transporter substrate-binding protein [Chloroflexota bacterium]
MPAPATPAGALRRGGTLLLHIPESPTLWPFVGSLANQIAHQFIYSQLTRYSPGRFQPIPDLAESWTPSPDATRWTFKLRRGVTWHDGAPFTSEDVRFSLDVYRNPATGTSLRPYLAPIVSVEARDPHEAVIATDSPMSSLPELLAFHCPMLPRHRLEGRELGKPDATFTRAPVGTGPFKFIEHRAGMRLALAANESFYLGRPRVDGVTLFVINVQSAALSRLRSGELHVALIAPNQIDAIRHSFDIAVEEIPQTDVRLFGGNHRHPRTGRLFGEPAVRRAISHAIDRPRLVENVTRGRAALAAGPVPAILQPWVNPSVDPVQFDPEKASRLLAEAGFKPGTGGILQRDREPLSFSFMGELGAGDREQAGLLIQRQLRDVGIDARPELHPFDTFMERWRVRRDFEAANWYYVTPPTADLALHWTTDAPLNEWGYSNPEVDRLCAAGRSELDPEKRRATFHKVQEILAQDQPVAHLYWPAELRAVSNKVRGLPQLPYRFLGSALHEVSVG